MDEISHRIAARTHHIETFSRKHSHKYAHWGMPRDELEVNLLVALCITLVYRDDHPDDTKNECQQFFSDQPHRSAP